MISLKLQFRAIGGAQGWFKAVISGVFANWLVGLAAFFATMGRSLAASTGERSEPGPLASEATDIRAAAQPDTVTSCQSPPLRLRLLPKAWPGAVSPT